MNQLVSSGTTILMAIIGVSILALLVSKNSNTTGVLQSGQQAFSGALGTALSPVTGSTGLTALSSLGTGGTEL